MKMRNKRIKRGITVLAMTGMMILNMAPIAVYAQEVKVISRLRKLKL